ncbi:MAG: hypothetical protein WA092_02640, partial [Minisyncoccales bacterium]
APTTNLCATGTASALSGTGPWTWTCAGLYGGATSGTCTAYKADNTLYGNKHSSGQCSCKGGSVVSAGGVNVCKVGSTCAGSYCCPSNWTRYGSWSEGVGACGPTWGMACGAFNFFPSPWDGHTCGVTGYVSGCLWRSCPDNGWAWGNSSPGYCANTTMDWPWSMYLGSGSSCTGTSYCPCCPSARLGCY